MIEIVNKIIKFGGKSFEFEDLFTREFLEYSNRLSNNYLNNTYYVNELYNSFILPFLSFQYFIKKNNIALINCSKANRTLKYYCIDLKKRKNIIKIEGNFSVFEKFYLQFSIFFFVISSTILLFYKMMMIPYKNVIKNDFNFSIARSIAGKSKLKNFNLNIEYEDFNDSNSIYRLSPKILRIKWVFLSYINSFRELRNINEVVKQYIGKNTSLIVKSYYSKRVVHTLLYYEIHNFYFNLKKNCTLFTTSNLDRFSVIEEILAKKYNIYTICIPHGLEYGFKFPKGFSCDKHYTNSSYSSKYLNDLYNTNKFIFDSAIAENMFSKNIINTEISRRVIFFTEPREIHINQNIIKLLNPILQEKGIKLFLRLHPKDCISNYSNFNIDLINDFNEAITGNICISRKSTILLEATYNNSVSAAILTNSKDESIFYTFPSLQSERIKITRSISDLVEWIIFEKEKFEKEKFEKEKLKNL